MPSSRGGRPAAYRLRASVYLVGLIAGLVVACDAPLVLTRHVEARRLASDLQLRFTQAADAANRAVLVDTDDAAAAAAREAEQARQEVARDIEQLHSILEGLGYSSELEFLDTFKARFDEYQKLDAEILPLAVENSNLKAQRLSFGPARDAATAFRGSLAAAVQVAPAAAAPRVDLLAARAGAAILEIQVLQAPHIAESEDAAMTRMEADMGASAAAARSYLEQMNALLPAQADADLAAAGAALDRFSTINRDIISLSRRNSDVRSLALTLGRKRTVTAQCEDQLQALHDELSTHEVTPTR